MVLGIAMTFNIAVSEDVIDCKEAIDFKSCTNNYRTLIEQYDWDIDVAYAVMMAESAGNANAFNPERHRGCNGSYSLFQVACIHDDVEKLKDPEYNVQRAYELYSKSGWKIWGAYTNKSYLRHMP